jgi:Glycosyl hydrolases family 38 N-terminal domain/Alpha mannosidase middle domain
MPRVHLVAHTHWDREWYLPFEAFRDKLVPTLDRLLELLEAEDDLTHFHLDGQTAMIDDYLAVRPEKETDIVRHVKSGRLSCGPWVTLADCFLVSGESICRNLEAGIARATELGGATMIGYLPDQFGHVGQMPQILLNAGIEVAVTWRGVGSKVTSNVFRWNAPDGSSVKSVYMPFGYGQGARMPTEPKAFVDRIRTEVGKLRGFAGDNPLLFPVGDDHEMPNAGLAARACAARDAGIDAHVSSLAEFLGALPAPNIAHRGEMRSAARANLLPNTYSVRPQQKVDRAHAEHLLERYAEPLAALVPGVVWPQNRFDEAWGLLHLNSAHDSVCGCSTDEVARAVDRRTRRAGELARHEIANALIELGRRVSGSRLLVFNPSPFERDGVPPLGWATREESVPEAEPVSIRAERDRLILPVGGGEVTLGIEDHDDEGDLYTFAPRGKAHQLRIEQGHWGVSAGRDRMDVTVTARATPGDDVTILTIDVDNRRPDHRLRILLDLPQRASETRAGSPFEIVTRPIAGEGGDSEPPPRQWPARGYVIAGGAGFLTEGVVEYELLGDRLALTLMRCVGTISRERLTTRKVVAGPDTPTPDAQLIGRQSFRVAVIGRDPGDSILEVWERYALRLLSGHALPGDDSLPSEGRLIDLDVPALSSIRFHDGKLAVRAWNPYDRPVEARVANRSLTLGPHRIETITFS